jgi:hypothetical protein
MGIALGWLAVVLAGLAGAPQPKSAGPEITYQFRVVEMTGLEWRVAACGQLKPAARRGAVTVWTAPRDFWKSLPPGIAKEGLMTPKVTAGAMAPAHITTRKNQTFVTRVAWKGEAGEPRSTTESVRTGIAATVAGRRLDQGVLVQLVIEDTDIRTVHTLNLNQPGRASHAALEAKSSACCADGAAQDSKCCTSSCLEAARAKVAASGGGCDPACPAPGHARTKDNETKRAAWHPSTEPACCADDEANAGECHSAKAADAGCRHPEKAKERATRSAQVQIPEIGREEAAGEWLIPHDEVLVVSFGPHTVADKDGKAVVRERLALITTEEAATSAGPNPFVRRPAVGLAPTVPDAPRTAIAPPMSIPSIPSRSIPQGIHADGTPAELPPLPEDEKAEQPASDSSQPLPSPQIKKPRPPAGSDAGPSAKPPATGDVKTSRAAFTKGQSWLGAASLFTVPKAGMNLTASFLPIPAVQFMLPLKPLSLKLPFGQKLELELLGRVVPDAEAASAPAGE